MDKPTASTPDAPVVDQDEPPELTAEAAATAGQAQLGIDYTETFTLEQAVASFNATRTPYKGVGGKTVTAEAQHLTHAPEWFRKHAGTFKLRRPSFYDELAMRVRFDQLAGPNPDALSFYTRWLVDATVVAEALVVSAPAWFSVEGVKDSDVLYMLHHWYVEWSARFREEVSPAS